ncbi:hypothetical protein IKF15_00960 [Candidatus Saccharibacteria bacterium]|nr:hypothetical protein [Candidatus Saccharibacteria bacterium]
MAPSTVSQSSTPALSVQPKPVSGLKLKLQKLKASLLTLYYSNPAKDLRIIIVTGASGRDVVAHYLQEIIKPRDPKTGLIIDPKNISSLYKQLFKIWKSGTDHAIIALDSAALAAQLCCKLPIFASVVTDSHHNGSANQVLSGTAISDLDAQSILLSTPAFFHILNHDDPAFATLAKHSAKSATLSYGRDRSSDLRLNRSKAYKKGTEANLTYGNQNFDVATYSTADDADSYMAAAALTAFAIGLHPESIIDGIANYEPTS